MDVNLRALRYFVMTAETGTISEAALKLNISQPSVSAAIQKLEEIHGVQLFIRVPTKGIRLTPDGMRFLERARLLLAQSDEFQHDVSAISQTLGGEITIGSFVNLTPAITAELVGAFHAKFPAIKVNIKDMDQHGILQELETGQIELAITFDLALQTGLSSSVVATLPPRAVLPPDDPLANDSCVSIHDVARRPFILMDLPHTRDYFYGLMAEHKIVPNIAFRCQSFEAVRAFVAGGLGVSILNIKPATDLTYVGRPVVMRPLIEPLRPLKVTILRNNRLRMRPALNLFVDFATSLIPALADPL